MKKLITVFLASVLALSCFGALAGCTDRGEILKVYNWGDYMDADVAEGFTDWYFNETNKKITVKYETFDTNEDMFTLLKTDEMDYDVICPSDYMAERMIKNGYAKKLNKDVIDPADYIDPTLLKLTKAYDPTSEYTVPYMWGTFGIMYNTSKFAEGSIDSWDALFTPNPHDPNGGKDKRVYMKNSIRDVYSVGGIYANKDDLSQKSNGFTDYNDEYKAALQAVFQNTTQAQISKVEDILSNQNKDYVMKYEVDDGKISMAQAAAGAGYLGLYWSCDAGYVMNDYEASSGIEKGNKKLFYSVPKEGSNVWVDSFLIGKYAKNEEAANYFLKYLCQKDVAIANTEYVGSSTPVAQAAAEHKASLLAQNLTDEDSFFNGCTEVWKNMYIDMMFPPQEVLDRCAIMYDFADKEPEITQMFIRVKGRP